MVPGADSQRALFLTQPGRAIAGSFCLVAPDSVSERACKCLFLVGVMLALLPSSLCICVTLPATKGGLFVLVQEGAGYGDFWFHASYYAMPFCPSLPAYRPAIRKIGLSISPLPSPHSQSVVGMICG